MPNWCSNVLDISHEDADKMREVAVAYNEGRLFEYFMPLPNGEWNYDWCVSNWGTKWDINSNGENVDPDQIARGKVASLYFDTAWGPALGAMQAATDQGFSVMLRYYEPGMAFAGIWEDGDDEFFELGGKSLAQLEAELPEELDECFGILDDIRSWDEENSEELPEEKGA